MAYEKQISAFGKIQYPVGFVPKRQQRFTCTYVGPRRQLKGKTADVVFGNHGPRECAAQFTDLNLPHQLTHGRTIFPMSDFYIHFHD